MPGLASRTRLSGLTMPSLSRASIAGSETITASKVSPSLIFCATTAGEPTVKMTLWPVSLLKSTASGRTAFCTAPTLSTVISAAAAMPASDTSIAAIDKVRRKARIVSSPRKCQWSAIILHPTPDRTDPPHARRRIAPARFAPHRHRADVRGGGVLCDARHDSEISQPLHEHAADRVGALHRRIPVPVHRVESMDDARVDAHDAARAADRALDAAARFHTVQFRRAALPPARRGHRAGVLDAVLRRRAFGADAGRVGALAPGGGERARR